MIDANDAVLVQQYLSSVDILTGSELQVADVTGDGIVNIFDVTSISLFIADEITEFENGAYEYIG